jgi:hypothetical protein
MDALRKYLNSLRSALFKLDNSHQGASSLGGRAPQRREVQRAYSAWEFSRPLSPCTLPASDRRCCRQMRDVSTDRQTLTRRAPAKSGFRQGWLKCFRKPRLWERVHVRRSPSLGMKTCVRAIATSLANTARTVSKGSWKAAPQKGRELLKRLFRGNL